MNITLEAETVRTIKERGGTWAIYQNVALDSADAGKIVCLRFGPECTRKEALDPMPDTPQYGPGWKYKLQATVKAEDLPDPDARDEEGLNAYDRALDAALDRAFEEHGIDPETMVVTGIESSIESSDVVKVEDVALFTRVAPESP